MSCVSVCRKAFHSVRCCTPSTAIYRRRWGCETALQGARTKLARAYLRLGGVGRAKFAWERKLRTLIVQAPPPTVRLGSAKREIHSEHKSKDYESSGRVIALCCGCSALDRREMVLSVSCRAAAGRAPRVEAVPAGGQVGHRLPRWRLALPRWGSGMSTKKATAATQLSGKTNKHTQRMRCTQHGAPKKASSRSRPSIVSPSCRAFTLGLASSDVQTSHFSPSASVIDRMRSDLARRPLCGRWDHATTLQLPGRARPDTAPKHCDAR